MNGTKLKRFRLGLGYKSAQQLAEASGYKAQTLLAMEICFVVKREALFRLDT